ncbi:hypothetical protein ACFLXO_06720 [Chloroflexota bacterium]
MNIVTHIIVSHNSKFMQHTRQFPAKVLVKIVLLSSARMARFMTENVPGIFVPQNLNDELTEAPKGKALVKVSRLLDG